jgi:hypothetical protein
MIAAALGEEDVGRRVSLPVIPGFENLFLKSIADSLVKRRKAICYRCDKVELSRAMDLKGDVPFERLDLEIRFGAHGSTRLHFTAWEDSMAWVWVGNHKKKVGWVFEIKLHTDLWNLAPRDIIQRIEDTIALSPWEARSADAQDQLQLEKVWHSEERPAEQRRRKRR